MATVYLLTVTIKGHKEPQHLIFSDVEALEKTVRFFMEVMTSQGRQDVNFTMAQHDLYSQDVIDELLKELILKIQN